MNGIKTIYVDDNWTIDMRNGVIRVSYFIDNHYVNEVLISKETIVEDGPEGVNPGMIFYGEGNNE